LAFSRSSSIAGLFLHNLQTSSFDILFQFDEIYEEI